MKINELLKIAKIWINPNLDLAATLLLVDTNQYVNETSLAVSILRKHHYDKEET